MQYKKYPVAFFSTTIMYKMGGAQYPKKSKFVLTFAHGFEKYFKGKKVRSCIKGNNLLEFLENCA